MKKNSRLSTALEKTIMDLHNDDLRYNKKIIGQNVTITGYIRKFGRSRSTIVIINERGFYGNTY